MAAAGAQVLIRLWTVVLVATAAASAGCGGQVGVSSSRVADAGSRTLDAGSSRFEIAYSGTDPEVRATGEMDYGRGTGNIRFEFHGKVEEELVLDGKRTYLHMPSLASSLGASKEWLSYDDPSSGEPLSLGSFDVQSTAVRNPARVLEFLLGTSGDVRQVGTEQVRGTETTHYRGAIDMKRVIERAPADQRADLRDELDWLAKDGFPTSIPFDAWIDDDGLARRLRLDLGDQDGGAETIEFYDFGVPVHVQPPPSSEVLTDEEFARLVEQEESSGSVCSSSSDASGEGAATTTGTETTQGTIVESCVTLTVAGTPDK